MILDQELGIIVIEVKSVTLDQIIGINGHCWQFKNFYKSEIYPYQQAKTQLFSLLDYFGNEPSLYQRIAGRVIIALPFISQGEWKQSELVKLPSIPPILFKENLEKSSLLLNTLKESSLLKQGEKLNPKQWDLALSLLSGSPVYCQEIHRVLSHATSRGKILQKRRSHLSQFDLQLEKIGKYIPNGCQRIRGIAGSGKTVILCQKAAIMHLKYPHWKIALIFFSRSLYQTITQQVDRWLRHYSQDQVTYSNLNENLLIFHAWGSKKQLEFYQYLCQMTNTYTLSVNETDRQSPIESLGEVCVNLLNKTAIPQVFDAILIGEAQDLMVERWLWQGKQPFFWLAYQALKSCNPKDSNQKRLIWAYDELQSLDTLKSPTATQLLGEELGYLVTGNYPYDISKTQTLNRCYRTPSPIIMAAYGLGMGLLRPDGIITGIRDKKEWEMLGFKVKGELISGQKITLSCSSDHDPNLINQDRKEPLIKFIKKLDKFYSL